MAVKVEALVRSLGKTYQELIDSELIIYKSPPKGSSGSIDLTLNMANEGIFMTFLREGKILNEITLTINKDSKPTWVFPNQLPNFLPKKMTRDWVHQNIGKPVRSSPPKITGPITFGWTDLYGFQEHEKPISMQINYDLSDNVEFLTFMHTSDLRW